ncbi:hypothetical protein HMPREF0758_4994 [Serratia odorifera DSM 4582]|uniref:Uncharacterized protein n=1 Tax=Serratia odorifera DSM 4582 TaxID=667129 RepID=D4E9Z4_SEROD|nr:hypothetical protein HMPREF0758_4994 [Serratia odorifera DSM 4582]
MIDFLGARGIPPADYVYSTHGEVTSATFVSGKQIRVPPGGHLFVFDDIIIPHKKKGEADFTALWHQTPLTLSPGGFL